MYADAIDILRDALDKSPMSQAELAARAGVSPSQLSRILSMKSTASQESLVGLAVALGINPESLMKIAGVLPQSSDDPWIDQQAYKLSKITDPILREAAERMISSLADQEAAAKEKGLNPKGA